MIRPHLQVFSNRPAMVAILAGLVTAPLLAGFFRPAPAGAAAVLPVADGAAAPAVSVMLAPELAVALAPEPGASTAVTAGEGAQALYRLVGVLGGRSDDPVQAARRMALIEQRASGDQLRVKSGDRLAPDFEVVDVADDAVVVRGPAGLERIGRTERAMAASNRPRPPAAAAGSPPVGAVAALRHGLRPVGENRWEFQREAVMGYYRQLMDEPARLVQVFDSMRPVYNASGRIDGYQLKIEGEAEFFQAVGLREGDRVRAVNSMPMTNRSRAEHFIRRFASEGLDTVVLEVERDGKLIKQIYEAR